jgi:pyruvate formate lyase activating enzyme
VDIMAAELKTAEHWGKLDSGRIRCRLCPHQCVLREGQSGICKVRTVRDGELRADSYGLLSSAHVDPIEKKPLYHFHPGAAIYSIGGWGCNFGCAFCQNWTLSQRVAESAQRCMPGDVVVRARASGCALMAYTYNEPLVGFEFVRDCARLAREAGLGNVLVTNGYVETDPAAELLPLIDALNVDIKSMDDGFYRKECHGTLDPVLRFCRQAAGQGAHVEITNLLIPTLNDALEQVERLAGLVRENLGAHTPLHLSAYRPEYKLRIRATPAATLAQAYAICRKELPYVYLGNVFSEQGQNTFCPGCGHALITRSGYATQVRGLRDGACVKCGRKAEIIA